MEPPRRAFGQSPSGDFFPSDSGFEPETTARIQYRTSPKSPLPPKTRHSVPSRVRGLVDRPNKTYSYVETPSESRDFIILLMEIQFVINVESLIIE
jgi:hypothetical protein